MELLSEPQQAPLDDDTGSHYQIRRLLGEGGFGHVFEAWDAKLCRSVALKRLKPLVDCPRPEQLVNEARLAASLRHPAFVKIFSIDGDGIKQSIVMELVQGQTLRQAMQERRLSVDIALGVAAQLADAMQEAHASGLVHGDLKPSNLMLDAAGQVRILDFGLARHIDPLATQSATSPDMQGTIAYMAPERLLGHAPSASGDIYALGVMLYEMLAGQRPFAGLNGLALAAAHMQSSSDAWPLPDDIPADVAALVRVLTAREPASRTPSMQAAHGALLRLAGLPHAASDNTLTMAATARAFTPAATPALTSALTPAAAHAVGTAVATAAGNAPAAGGTPSTALAPAPPSGLAVASPSYDAAQAGLWPALRLSVRRRPLPWAGGVLLLALGVWQAPALYALIAPAPPAAEQFSEAAAMRAGLAAMRVFDQEGNQLLAIREFNAVLQHNPAHAAAASGLAMMYTMRYRGSGRDITWLQRADASAQLALKLDDQLALAHVARAWVLEFQAKPELAMQATETALRLDPSNIYGLYGKARQLGGNKRYAEADVVMAQALRLYPKERLLHALAGALRYLQRDYAGAESIFRHCIQMEPDAASSYNDLSATLTALGRGDEALQVLQQGLQIHPNWELYTNLGNALFERADYIGAAKAFEYAVSPDKGNPNNFIAWANLADTQRWIPTQVAASRQSYQRAIALLAPLMAHSPDNVAYVSRAALYEARAGNKAAAAQHMRRALALAPAASEVHYRAAITAELGGDRAQALALLTRALALGYPLNPIDTEADLMDLRRDSRYQHLLMESARKK